MDSSIFVKHAWYWIIHIPEHYDMSCTYTLYNFKESLSVMPIQTNFSAKIHLISFLTKKDFNHFCKSIGAYRYLRKRWPRFLWSSLDNELVKSSCIAIVHIIVQLKTSFVNDANMDQCFWKEWFGYFLYKKHFLKTSAHIGPTSSCLHVLLEL